MNNPLDPNEAYRLALSQRSIYSPAKTVEEAFQQRDWAMASLRELSEAYSLLQAEHSVTADLLDTMTYANANSIKESLRSDQRNERHIAKLCREIMHMQRKLHKRRMRINHLQDTIGKILKERPIVTDYNKMGSAALGRVVHTLSEKYREVCHREREEAAAKERLFQIDIKDSRKLVDALRKQGFNDEAIIEFMQVTKAVNSGQV